MSFNDCVLAIAIAALLILAGAALISALPTPQKSTVRTHFILSFCASLVLLTAYWNLSAIWGNQRQGFSGSDDEAYHLQGQIMADSGDVFNTRDRNPGFTIWTAILYKTFGANTIIVRIFNIFFRCLWTVPIAFIAPIYKNVRMTRLAILLTAWAPPPMLASILHIKDLIAGLALLTSLASIIYIEKSRISAVSLLCAVAVLWSVRRDLLIIIAVIAFIHLCGLLLRRRATLAGAVALTALVLVVASHIPDLIQGWGSVRGSTYVPVEIFRYAGQNVGNAHGLAPFFINNVGEIWKLPFTMATLLIMPFPPKLNGDDIFQIADSFSSLWILTLLPFVFIGCIDSIRKWTSASFPAYGGFLGCGAVTAVAFPGLPRYRLQLLGLVCLMAALGIVRLRSNLWLFVGFTLVLSCALVVGTVVYF
jgi:hypothetical protein